MASLTSWVKYSIDCDFPLQNLPYGVFRRSPSETPRIGVAIGDLVLDLRLIDEAELLPENVRRTGCFREQTLNHLMSLGKTVWKEARTRIQQLLSHDTPILRDNTSLCSSALIPQKQVEMLLPANIGDYTDYNASREHATNVGTIFRGAANALQPNWLWLPVGYHGRSSSIVVSGTAVRRPCGQIKVSDDLNMPPKHAPSCSIDFELEMGLFVGPGNELGYPIAIDRASEHMFGMVLINDWSARDIQSWEYIPLGPFGAKNWATTISPWVVTMEALEPFRCFGPKQEPKPLPYLCDTLPSAYDIRLFSAIQSEQMSRPQIITSTNLQYMYWSSKQQLVHHTVTGCNMRPGDLLGSGTISGPTQNSLGSLLELSWKGSIRLEESGEERKFIQDGDTVILSGYCQGNGYRVGFGQCSGKLLPSILV